MKLFKTTLFTSGLLLMSVAHADCVSSLNLQDLNAQLANSNQYYAKVKSPVQCKSPKSAYDKAVCSDPKLKTLDLLALRADVYAYENATATELTGKKLTAEINESHKYHQKAKTKEAICKTLLETDSIDSVWK
ncbi:MULTISPECIES: hypothetical protein [unclassified Moraxella]|uniref:hypothetical protein n=1 Tax=unclassified Moraxella TaxID=2685852 RepID=UPI003AF96F3D